MVAVALSRGLSEESASVSAVHYVCFLLWPDSLGALLGDTEERLREAGGEGRKSAQRGVVERGIVLHETWICSLGIDLWISIEFQDGSPGGKVSAS